VNSEKILFVNHFRERVMELLLPNGLVLTNDADVEHLKRAWQNNVLEWHTPYKCLVNFSALDLLPDATTAFVRTIKHLRSFFMSDLVIFCENEQQFALFQQAGIPGKLTLQMPEARTWVGLTKPANKPSDNISEFAGRIQFVNHHETGLMILTFSAPVRMETEEDVDELLEAIEGNILKWHRAYALVVDTDLIADTPTARTALTRAACLARGFFCVDVQGFGAESKDFPIPIQLTRHRALELAAEALKKAASHVKTNSLCNSKEPG
jgi:hypothetical protein